MPTPAPSQTAGETDVPLIEQTIGDNFDATVSRFADREALVDVAQGRRWTYAELRRDVDELARGLLAAGIAKGDRVGIWAPNCAQWTLVQYATAKVGAILVTINPSYRTHELEYVLRQAGVRMIVAAPRFRTNDYAAMIEEVRGAVAGLEQVVLIGTDSWHALVDDAARVTAEQLSDVQASLENNDPINIQYTSGTTGFPRAQHSATATSSTTASSSGSSATIRSRTGSAFRCPSTTASAWSWATSRARPTVPRWSSPRPGSTRRRPCGRPRRSGSPPSTECRRCSSPSGTCPASATSTSPGSARASWPAHPARPS